MCSSWNRCYVLSKHVSFALRVLHFSAFIGVWKWLATLLQFSICTMHPWYLSMSVATMAHEKQAHRSKHAHTDSYGSPFSYSALVQPLSLHAVHDVHLWMSIVEFFNPIFNLLFTIGVDQNKVCVCVCVSSFPGLFPPSSFTVSLQMVHI